MAKVTIILLLFIGFVFTVQGSTGSNIAPAPEVSPIEGILAPTESSVRSNVPSSGPQPNASDLLPPPAAPPMLAPLPPTKGLIPSSPVIPVVSPPLNTATPPVMATSPSSPMEQNITHGKAPVQHDPLPGPGGPASPVIPIVSPPISNAPPPIPAKGHESPVEPNITRAKAPIQQDPLPVPGGPSAPIIPIVSPPLSSAPPPLVAKGHESPMEPNITQGKAPVSQDPLPVPGGPSSPPIPIASPPLSAAPPPLIAKGHEPPTEPNITQAEAPVKHDPVPMPVASPSTNSSHDSPNIHHTAPEPSPIINQTSPDVSPSSDHGRNTSFSGAPKPDSIVPVASPPIKSGPNRPSTHAIAPAVMPSVTPAPTVSPIGQLPESSPAAQPAKPRESPSTLPAPDVSRAATPPNIDMDKDGTPVASPPDETAKHFSPTSHSPTKGSSSAMSPSTHKDKRKSSDAPVPVSPSRKSPQNKWNPPPAFPPSIPTHKQTHAKAKISSPAPALSPPSSENQGSVVSPSSLPTRKQKHYAPPPYSPGSSTPASRNPIPDPAPSPSPRTAISWTKMPILPPKASPFGSSSRNPKVPLPQPIHALPPPPPNEDCSSTVCMDPYTNTPPGSPCSCVLPMQVGLQLNVALYTFFPLVSELAQEIAAGVFMKQSQVRIMGANAASQQPEKTIVLIDLVPLGNRFDNTTASLTSQRFWLKQVVIKASYFGDYEVLYVRYPGLPPSPPSANSGIIIIDDGPGNNNNARTIKPLGVDVPGHQKNRLGPGAIAVIALSASVVVVLCSAVAWVLLVRRRGCTSQPKQTPRPLPASTAKPSGTTGSMMGSAMSSASLSFGSSIAPYTGSAKTYSTIDMERATHNFDESRIIGEGGFGRVYGGVLEDGTQVAVKVLKRDDHQGGREFLAEVEMLSRLHHRNLVKLIGICAEERNRCLVYELIPNGSVESHLHGFDKESAPLDWDARIKIALGAARGLAYLHEDSSPRVIHRDFKSSNILLEDDFTPKVSDFGLARTALDEENRHISTRVMGTFGYVAPEYAMTGHLLVKSDVYSYGVVLLELLTGRKPVDMSQPAGEENLVAWARPLLTSKPGLEAITDPSLGPNVPFDSVAKVAAIASMCVQPEVSHRPFMGEVVQALKLVRSECDEAREVGSRCSSRDFSIDMDADAIASTSSARLLDAFGNETIAPDYDSEPDIERGLSMSGMFSTSVRYGREVSGSFRRCSSSGGPLTRAGGRHSWQRMRRLRGESVSEHGIIHKQWPGSD
ncbi:Protein kinase superfamily protein [Euphorbia peplus]|nr:Protein kinase superfamily protein [Euphorbia peplus]